LAKQPYNNDNRGALWVNDERREGKEDPQFRGNLLLRVPMDECIDNGDGTVTIHRFISAWQSHSDKVRKDGQPVGDYLSLAVGQKCRNTHGD